MTSVIRIGNLDAVRDTLVAQTVKKQTKKNLPSVLETQAPSLDWEDLLEKGMATHSSILVW